ncbi:hypothetical protein Y032_0449g1671 [Ancylostoma ceylanicum]|uniref:Uncharacterized protein n=1 Tax=Ancylostoma ceylanicum TaxID=53326 RepID=A0A016WYT0_9BILA|nr:hypothetical protein Y032_0449g1671 [Ancylostoma ceylanicum]
MGSQNAPIRAAWSRPYLRRDDVHPKTSQVTNMLEGGVAMLGCDWLTTKWAPPIVISSDWLIQHLWNFHENSSKQKLFQRKRKKPSPCSVFKFVSVVQVYSPSMEPPIRNWKG